MYRYLANNIIHLLTHSFKLLEKISDPRYTIMFQIHYGYIILVELFLFQDNKLYLQAFK